MYIVCTLYVHCMQWVCNIRGLKTDNLRVKLMEGVLCHFERIASCTHNSPEQVRLPFHTSKRCQGTLHDVGVQYIVELRWCPSSASLPGGALWSTWALSGNPKSSCRFSPIHSASFVGNHRRTGCAVRYVYSSHCGHATPWGSVTRGAGSWTNSILLGLRRLISRRTQPVEFREFACIQPKN